MTHNKDSEKQNITITESENVFALQQKEKAQEKRLRLKTVNITP